jgi:lipopolysaccharide biosynthesis regulator YciM
MTGFLFSQSICKQLSPQYINQFCKTTNHGIQVSFKSIITFLFFTLLSVYFSFLNPHEVDIHFAQGWSLQLPMVVLFLGSVLLGVLVAGFLHGTLSLKNFFINLKKVGRVKRQNKNNHRSERLLEEAENFLACGYVTKAVAAYEKILKISPSHVHVHIQLGNIAREEGDVERALKLHLRAVEIAPENLNVLYGLAEDYCAKAIPKKEMEVLKKILEFDRRSPRVLCRMREVYLKSEDWVSAVEVQRKLVIRIEGREQKEKEKRMLGQYIYKSGARYFNNDNFELAITEFKRALRENAQCLSAHILLGDAYLKMGDRKGALKSWKKGYANTKSMACMMRMEEVYRDLGQVGEMVKEYKEAIRNSKNGPSEILIMQLGVLCLEEKIPQETIRVIEENTDSEKAIIPSLILGDAYKQDHNETKSKKALENATRQVKRAIFNFKCNTCGKVSDKWTDHCLACNTFDAMECFLGITSG